MSDFDKLIKRADALLARVEQLLPAAPAQTDWKATAFRWRKRNGHGAIDTIRHVHRIALGDLCGIDRQKKLVEQNTRQFVEGLPANNVLLTGARGTGKSSLIKALLNKYAPRGLRVIEVEKQDLIDLPEIVELIAQRPERFVLYCDDLSFEADEPGYKALKVVLDGSVAEKISLSERFGVWVSFYPFDQDEYLEIVTQWLAHFKIGGAGTEAVRHAALQWALQRGSRSGRVAWQFARDWAGRARIARGKP